MKDFFEPLFNKERDERRSVRFLKVATIIVGLLPVVIALGANNVLHIAYLGKGLRAALAVLVLLAFYAPSFSNGSGAFIGIIVNLTATVVSSEERRVGKECVRSVDLGGRRIIKKKKP